MAPHLILFVGAYMHNHCLLQFFRHMESCSWLSNPNTYHYQIMRFLIDILANEPHRGLLMAFRHSGKSTVVGIFAACVLYIRPQTRILILSAESGLATRMVMHIRHMLENHPLCSELVPSGKKRLGVWTYHCQPPNWNSRTVCHLPGNSW